jgi:transcriptional regulator with XRE-family HTH domain
MAKKARGLTKSLHLPENRAFCDLLVRARHSAHLTQAAVAKKLKRPQSFVAKVEGGERRLDVIEFVDFVEAIEADPVKILRALLKTRD